MTTETSLSSATRLSTSSSSITRSIDIAFSRSGRLSVTTGGARLRLLDAGRAVSSAHVRGTRCGGRPGRVVAVDVGQSPQEHRGDGPALLRGGGLVEPGEVGAVDGGPAELPHPGDARPPTSDRPGRGTRCSRPRRRTCPRPRSSSPGPTGPCGSWRAGAPWCGRRRRRRRARRGSGRWDRCREASRRPGQAGRRDRIEQAFRRERRPQLGRDRPLRAATRSRGSRRPNGRR